MSEPTTSPATASDESTHLPRRLLGRAVLLGASAVGAATVVGSASSAEAAPPNTAWKLGGNPNVSGTNFLGTKNAAALILKTNDTERARINSNGYVGVGRAPNGAYQLAAQHFGNTGTGVRGDSPNSISTAIDAKGVQGVGTTGVQGNGQYFGVNGQSVSYAVFGFTTPDTGGIGVYGRGGQGVKGRSYTGLAVLGDTDSGTGVKGESYSNGSTVNAVHGEAYGQSNNGVLGEASNGTAAYGVWGISTTGYAGVFSGNVLVTGTLSKGGGSFKIDHPLEPENKYLYHSFVESPDMMNVYNGNVTTDGRGLATVRMPDYFTALNRDFRYQLTVLGDFAQAVVSKEMRRGSFQIRTDRPRVKVSWQVTGIRKDPFANANRIPVEQDKTESERGRYLHPRAYGKPADRDVQHERLVGVKGSRAARTFEPGDRRG